METSQPPIYIQFKYSLMSFFTEDKEVFFASDFSCHLRCFFFLNAVLTGKGRVRKAFQCLCMFHVICHQIPCSIQQRGTVIPFAIYVLVESFLVGFARFSSRKASSWLPKPYPYKIGQQLSTPPGSPAPGFNSDIPFYASSVKSSLVILSAHMLSLFPTCLNDSSLSLEEVILEY